MVFEPLWGDAVFTVGEDDFVVEAEELEEPCCADAARGLEEVEGDFGGHVCRQIVEIDNQENNGCHGQADRQTAL